VRDAIADYVTDAEAMLAVIGAPTRVGHSLGGVVAGVLAQSDSALVHAALMLDPAWYFGVPEEFAGTVYPQPTRLIRCDSTLGAAFPDNHAERIHGVKRCTDIVHYAGSDHFPQRTFAFAKRFRGDLERFLPDE